MKLRHWLEGTTYATSYQLLQFCFDPYLLMKRHILHGPDLACLLPSEDMHHSHLQYVKESHRICHDNVCKQDTRNNKCDKLHNHKILLAQTVQQDMFLTSTNIIAANESMCSLCNLLQLKMADNSMFSAAHKVKTFKYCKVQLDEVEMGLSLPYNWG